VEIVADLRIVLTTWPLDRPVDEVAATLVREELAACVHVHAAVTSHYRWKGALERSDERPLVIKTTAARLPALVARLTALHPYEVPELVVLEAAASATYGAWVRDAVGGAG
jgi:periplasmic divalent cation tolerance protein